MANDEVRAFCGLSGAGKTTTAHAFVASGLRPFSEDLLVLGSLEPPTVRINGERLVHGWAEKAAANLFRASSTEISTQDLGDALRGKPIPVREIWCIEATRRNDGECITVQRLNHTDATLALMTSIFLGAASSTGWRRFLDVAGTLAERATILAAQMPSGLEKLSAAARDYSENSAS
jgi:hypothetical protein